MVICFCKRRHSLNHVLSLSAFEQIASITQVRSEFALSAIKSIYCYDVSDDVAGRAHGLTRQAVGQSRRAFLADAWLLDEADVAKNKLFGFVSNSNVGVIMLSRITSI